MTEHWHIGDTGQFDSLIADFANHPIRGGSVLKEVTAAFNGAAFVHPYLFGRKLLGRKGPIVSNQDRDLVS